MDAQIPSALIWLEVRAAIDALIQPGTDQESLDFAFTISAGGRLLYSSKRSSSRKRTHLPRAPSGTGGSVLLLPRGGKRVGTSFKKKRIKVGLSVEEIEFFPILGSCKHLTARCECPPGSWMRPKGFPAFHGAVERPPAPHQGSSMERQHLFQGFQTVFQHPDTIPTPPLACK